jgi:hypothetical protein
MSVMRTAAIVIAFVVASGIVAAVLPALIMGATFAWDWLVHDDVIAIGDLKATVASSMAPREMFVFGILIGACVAGMTLAVRWFDGPDR